MSHHSFKSDKSYKNIEQEREQKKLGKKKRAETEKVLLTKISVLSWAGHVFRFGSYNANDSMTCI